VNRAIFLDRDGTVIRDSGYIRNPDLVEPLEGARDALRRLSTEGWLVIVVSNQSGVGRGMMSADEMAAVQKRFAETMREFGAPIQASYFCIHAPEENCECRKPSPSMLFRAAEENDIDLRRSWMIGDRESDILSGKSAGCSTIWLENETHTVPRDLPNFVARSWREIAEIISRAGEDDSAN